MTRYFVIFLLCLTACALEPITEPRRIDSALEPTLLPARVSAEKPTYTVESGTVSEQLELQGRVGSAVEIPLEATLAGTVSAVLVNNGSAIVAGDVLALLDTSELEAELEVVNRALESAETRLDIIRATQSAAHTSATLTLERANLVLEAAQANNTSATDLRILEIDVELAQIALDQLENNSDPDLQTEIIILKQQAADLQARIEAQRIIARGDGDLINFNLQAGGRVREGQIIGTLVDLDQPVIWANVTAGVLAQLEEGMTVQLTLPDGEDVFTGSIDLLPFPDGINSGRDGMVGVVSAETLPPFASRVNITITLAENNDTLWLPPAALREFAGQPFVIVRDGDSERRVDVEIGIVSTGRIEITNGLEAGAVVVAP